MAEKEVFSALAVQRLVNPDTGTVSPSGRCPVFGLYTSYGDGVDEINSNGYQGDSTSISTNLHTLYEESAADQMYYIVVRELDIYAPSKRWVASYDQSYVNSIINIEKQMAVSETGAHFITFPNGFNTNRYMYLEEMDMMAFTGAQVISQFNNAKVNVYGEAAERTYKAGHSNSPGTTGIQSPEGMRLLYLIDAPDM